MTYNQYPYSNQASYGYQPTYSGGAQGQAPTYGAQAYTAPAQAGAMYPTATPQAPVSQIPGMLPLEQSYIENILRLNKGKLATVYAIFDTVANTETGTKVFRGIIEAAGRDHLILSDPETGMRFLIPMVYFGYATFDEELEYDYPYGVGFPGATTYSPR